MNNLQKINSYNEGSANIIKEYLQKNNLMFVIKKEKISFPFNGKIDVYYFAGETMDSINIQTELLLQKQ